MNLVILSVSRAAYMEIRQRLLDAGAPELILWARCGSPERLNMGEIALGAIVE